MNRVDILKDSKLEYYITKNGELFYQFKNRLIRKSTFMSRDGYERVRIGINGRKCELSIHRLVANTFIANPENKPQVNHKDGNKLNNNIQNLEWVTAKENAQHARYVLNAIPTIPVYKINVPTEEIEHKYDSIIEAVKEHGEYVRYSLDNGIIRGNYIFLKNEEMNSKTINESIKSRQIRKENIYIINYQNYEVILYLKKRGFLINDIARLFNVDRKTIRTTCYRYEKI